jgi:hypothetical protein
MRVRIPSMGSSNINIRVCEFILEFLSFIKKKKKIIIIITWMCEFYCIQHQKNSASSWRYLVHILLVL